MSLLCWYLNGILFGATVGCWWGLKSFYMLVGSRWDGLDVILAVSCLVCKLFLCFGCGFVNVAYGPPLYVSVARYI